MTRDAMRDWRVQDVAKDIVETHAQATPRDWGSHDHALYKLIVAKLLVAERDRIAALRSRPAPPDDLVSLVREWQEAMRETFPDGFEAMTEETQALVDRLEAIAARFDMTSTERYEQDSEAFYAATGYMAPGKDVPMAMGGQDEAERRAAHEAWIAERNRQQRDGLRDAAAALTTLARDYARTKEAAEVVYASSKANAEEVQRLSRDLETADKCNDILKGEVAAARQELDAALAERDEARGLHQELMFQVSSKFPDETRHQTAKRYLREHDRICGKGGPASAAREGQ